MGRREQLYVVGLGGARKRLKQKRVGKESKDKIDRHKKQNSKGTNN